MPGGKDRSDVWFCHVYNKKKNEASPRSNPISQVPLLNPNEMFDPSTLPVHRGRRLNWDALQHDTFHMVRPDPAGGAAEDMPKGGRKYGQPKNAGRWFVHREGKQTTPAQSKRLTESITLPSWMEHISKEDAEPEETSFDEHTCVPPFCIADETDYEDASMHKRPRRRRVKKQTMPVMAVPKRFDKNGNVKKMVVIEHEDKGFAHLIANQYQDEWISKEKEHQDKKATKSRGNFVTRNKQQPTSKAMYPLTTI